jgi:hypothetical protein
MIPLIRGWRWLDEAQQLGRLADVAMRALAVNAWSSDEGITWHPVAGRENSAPPLSITAMARRAW